MVLIGGFRNSMGNFGMVMVVVIRNNLRYLSPHGISRLSLRVHSNGLLVETFPTGCREGFHLKILPVLRRNTAFFVSCLQAFSLNITFSIF